MSKQISKEQFEALAAYPNRIETERDIDYAYDTIVDQDGNELAFATYKDGECLGYTLKSE